MALRPARRARPAQAARRLPLTNRIVSLVPSITELVCELGLAGELVGRTGFCMHPEGALKAIPKVGGTKSVNLKKIRALAPTHVIVNVDENRKETADALAGFVPNVIVTHPLAPLDNLALYRRIGIELGRPREAEALCARFENALREVRKREFRQRNVLYLIWKDPWMTVSRDTYVSRTLALFGLQTLPEPADARYPEITLREPWLRDIELVLLSSEPYRFREKHLGEIRTALNKPSFLIDGEMTSWYGSRAIQGLRYLSRFAATL
jgi:ABC-type Fe3+-hydroxamate transport system substrate-binding protein